MKKRLSTLLFILVFLTGLSLLLYPTVSDWWNSLHQSRAIAGYTQEIANLDDEKYQQLLKDAQAYNETLTRRTGARFQLSEKELLAYNAVLDVSGTGIMGYIEIPVLQTKLPVYHGTGNAALSTGVGHIEGSSLPVGGQSTHCVLSGHRGLPSAKLFTNLDRLVEGDIFLLHTLDETLTYEVDQIRIVTPQETSDLYIEEGMDYCTLVTCTPYGVNTHRLLVRGRRIETVKAERTIRVTADAIQIEPLLVAPFAAIPLLLALLVLLLFKTRKKKPKKKGSE
ncbi:MAG: class C sortase [Clostridiales bacterium]|jgi:sortase A|nr:class C sortase [Clostridiales bacterium]